ncbi:SGNH/GDSL hydrolase family protein [Actinoplanes sp. NBRC 103695]|uniref:SGNH/GDSL hydrolase family protein n=1 Tax=Actinoplanes sp. NBRC 103695 TaxID=3032202 RepID=UPI002553A229|nr:SGNH/GDSL hydrolase family protein [Actinoplanes sp. NBRC 103695]
MALIPMAVVSAPAQAAATKRYVALGDSYAAGVGTDPSDANDPCRRSPRSYPRTWAAAHASTYTLTDVTCSGATIADVRARQLSALNDSTALVTITVGGNDGGFRSTVTNCLTGSDALCSVSTQLGSYYATHQLVDDLVGLYAEVKRRAPHAAIVVLGYPRLVALSGSCGVDVSLAKRKALNSNADAMAQGIGTATSRQGIYFVDMTPVFNGHEACGSSAWINGVNPARLDDTFHPNAAGHKAYSDILTIVTDWHAAA